MCVCAGHSGAQQMGTGYTQESAAYGRSAYPTTQDTGYNQQLARYSTHTMSIACRSRRQFAIMAEGSLAV